ncbi:MAG: tetratricopeptide repeat protein, partial [Verrucomicrobiota bacterium]
AEAEEINPADDPAAAITAWLAIARDFPDSGVGKNHLESLLDQLRHRPKPLSTSEFNSLRSLITEAADQKILSATLLLADQLRLTDPPAAFQWYTAATAIGHIPSFAVLGFITERGFPGKKPHPEEAVKFFQTGADQGDPSATFGLGRAYLTGRGVPAKNLPLAIQLIQQASDAGDTRATDLLGDCYAHATGVPLNFDEAFRLFTQAADRGNPASIGNLGVLYMTGRGVPAPNPKKAAELFEKGARADDPPSMFNFAQCLNEGLGTAKNELESKIWFRRSAEAGDQRATAWCLKYHLPFTPH